MIVGDYLARIGYHGGLEPTAENLSALVKAHRFAVPYETLDLWRKRRTTLRLELVYDKIVTRRRGGYCFELNGLFAWALRELGYNVREYFGRWLLGEKETEMPMRRHRVICVALPGLPNQIVDVGIGLPFLLSPIDFVFQLPQPRDGRMYRIVRDPALTCLMQMSANDGKWVNLFSFDTAPQLPVDFEYAHWWCQTHPDSSFLTGLWVYRLFPNAGAASLSYEKDPERPESAEKTIVLVRFDRRGGEIRTALRDENAIAVALKEYFDIIEN